MSVDHAFIHPEMMVHPALFIHAQPQHIAIISPDDCGILQETLKHPNVLEVWHPQNDSTDPRVRTYSESHWLKNSTPDYFDIIIVNTIANPELLQECFPALHANGLLIQISHSPFQLAKLKADQSLLLQTGFKDVQSLQFPEPNGWRTAWIAAKKHISRHVSEKTIFNRTFKTHYYNFDTHKAAFVLPEFMRHELEETSL